MTLRSESTGSWHEKITPDGRFRPEAGRYHLYIGHFCPFTHRVNLVRHLCGLESTIPVSVVKPYPKHDTKGWQFAQDSEYEGSTVDNLFNSGYLSEVYHRDDQTYRGKYSVPLLWDTQQERIVSTQSAEMVRWLPDAFRSMQHTTSDVYSDLYPTDLRAVIDKALVWVQSDLNLGVYKAGFAETQEQYDANVPAVFAALNRLEQLIYKNGGPYVLGERLTELDVYAFPTIIRFDAVYVQHFKCNLGTIRANYPVIHEWMKNLYHNVSGFRETTDFRHIRDCYYKTQPKINKFAITAMGPFPLVEEGVTSNFRQLEPGTVSHPAVLRYQKEMYSDTADNAP